MRTTAFLVAALTLLTGTGVANEALFQAAMGGSVAEIEVALRDGADIDAIDVDGNTPLLLAVMHNTADVVEVLLDTGADAQYVNPRTGMGVFGLVWRNPNSSLVSQALIERGLFAVVGPRGSGSQPEPTPTPSRVGTSTEEAGHGGWRGLSRDIPFDMTEVESGWVESRSFYVPFVSFSIQSATGAAIEWLTVRAEFFVTDSSGELVRLGGGVFDVVGVTDVPLRGDARRYVRLESDLGFGQRRSPPITTADLYYRVEQGGAWIQFRTLNVNPAHR